jgi:hypothetical protein
MRPIVLTVAGAGVSLPAVMDIHLTPFNVGFGVSVTGTVSYTVQHTFDDVLARDFNPATATWFPHEDLVSQTNNQDGNYAFPVRAIRLNVGSSTGTVTITILQAGIT